MKLPEIIKPYKINRDNYDNGNNMIGRCGYETEVTALFKKMFGPSFTHLVLLCFLSSKLLIPFLCSHLTSLLFLLFMCHLHPICLLLEFLLFWSLLSCQMFYSFFSPLIALIFVLFPLIYLLLFCSRISFTHNIFHLHISCSVLYPVFL